MRYLLLFVSCSIFLLIRCHTTSNTSLVYRATPPFNLDSTVNMIIEIPAGTTAKYEMNKQEYALQMDSINGQPRYINYLGYPGNYGMIPNTLLPKSRGGDGDPLDVILLGAAKERGSIQKITIIGVLELLDNGEQDDKLIAIPVDSKWSKVSTIEDLDEHYPGVKTIIATFFENYKGGKQMEIKGWGDVKKAMFILQQSISH